MARVALFAQDLAGGGAERMMINLASGLCEMGIPVDLVLVRKQGPYLSQVPAAVRIIDLGTGRVLFSIGALARYLRKERPIALLSTLVHVNVAAVLAGRMARVDTRIVVREANYASLARATRSSVLERWAYRLIPWAYRHADAVVCISKGVADDLARNFGIPKERMQWVPNPVVASELQRRAAEDVEHPWLAPGEPPVVLGVGRLTEQKDFATLIRAFAQVRRLRPARLVILGEGELRAQLEALIRDLHLEEDVVLPGFIPNPFAWMRRADVFVLSSLFEGCGNVLVEAMACGTPVIATNCPSGPAEILQGGTYGTLVPVGDVQSIADAVVDVLDNSTDPGPLAKRAADYSVTRVSQHYWEVLSGSYSNKRMPEDYAERS